MPVTDDADYPAERTRYRADRFPPSVRCHYRRADDSRCKKWAVRSGKWCRFHQLNARHFELKREETQMAQAVASVVQAALGSVELAQRDLREAAPRAVAVLVATIEDESAPRASRVRAAELILRASGASLERVDVTLGLAPVADAAEVVRARLDRLAAAATREEG
jgi:hypothetical protein